MNEYAWTSRSFISLQALNLADAGAESAIWEIAHNNEQFTLWAGTNPKTITLSSFKDGDNKTIGDIIVSADQTSAHHYTITSTGFVPNAAKPVTGKTVKVFVLPKAIFNIAAFGNHSISLAGITLVDSYDSGLGPYSSLTARENGDVGTNDILTMMGNASVKGGALVAPGGSDFYGTIYAPEGDVSTSGNSNIFGAIVGDTVTLSGTGALHYDESLAENGPSQGFTIVYWQEN